MARTDDPYLPLYVDDWMNNLKLKECTPSAHGLMISIMCLMHKSQKYGVLELKQKYKQNESKIKNFASYLHKMTSFDVEDINLSLSELIENEVLIIEEDFLISRRMVKDAELSTKRSISGSQKGKQNDKQNNEQITNQITNNKEAKEPANAGIGNGIGNGFVNRDREGVGEEGKNPLTQDRESLLKNDSLTSGMINSFKRKFPEYLDDDADFRSCRLIAVKLHKHLKLSGIAFDTIENQKAILKFWEILVEFISLDSYFCKLQLSVLQTQFSGLIKSYQSLLKTKLNGHSKYNGNIKSSIGKDFQSSTSL